MNMQALLGDWRWFWSETLRYFSVIPQAWDSSLNTGIGQSGLSTLWINQYLNLTSSLTTAGLPWPLVALIFWQLPPLILSALGAYYAFGLLFPNMKRWGYVAAIIYTCNTYFFLMYLGGQLGVALAYGVFPFVVGKIISSLLSKEGARSTVVNGFLLGLLVLFDIRIAFLAVLFVVFAWVHGSRSVRDGMYCIVIPLCVATGLHAYWILPLVLFRQNPLAGAGVVAVGEALSFFSFADFSHAFSLLHPNWPENIFGKTYFLQPEFLLIPLAAFFVLLVRKKEYAGNVRFFAFVALTGAFLSKGTQEPFGVVYERLYSVLPGFTMFRDPTKFYSITALAYAMLIPHMVHWVSEHARRLLKNRNASFIVVVIVVFLWLVPLQTHALRIVHSLKGYTLPEEYGRLTRFLADQPQFFRTLWIPQWQRFGYFSDMHPAIGRFELLRDASAAGQLVELHVPQMQEKLSRLAVKYIIVPYDSEKELFLHDRTYDEQQYNQTLTALRGTEWLKEIRGFGDIGVFELIHPGQRRFFVEGKPDLQVASRRKSATQYEVTNPSREGSVIVFSEAFDPKWIAKAGSVRISSLETPDGLNSFAVSESVSTLLVEYDPQRAVYLGLVLTGATLGSMVVTYLMQRKQ